MSDEDCGECQLVFLGDAEIDGFECLGDSGFVESILTKEFNSQSLICHAKSSVLTILSGQEKEPVRVILKELDNDVLLDLKKSFVISQNRVKT